MEKLLKEEGAPMLEAGRADGDEAIAILAQAVTALQETVEELAEVVRSQHPVLPGKDGLMTPAAAAAWFGIGRDTMYEFVNAKTGPIPHLKNGNRKYVDIEEAWKWIKRREIA